MPVIHELKCHDVYFDAIQSGLKSFEVRRDDRGFQKGDTVRLIRMTKNHVGVFREDRYPHDSSRKILDRKIIYIF